MKITKIIQGDYQVTDPRFNEDDFGGKLHVYKAIEGGWKTSYTDQTVFATKSNALAHLDLALG
tara:strand:- start:495 stop:683 length:189 start_codon:yes stop_codon:yes gene_type:complete